MPVPQVRVEVAFESAPDDPVQRWIDISPYVRLADGVTYSRGRADEYADVEPGRLAFTVNNADGRFTYGNTGSPYFPGRNIVAADALTNTAAWFTAGFGYDFTQPDRQPITDSGMWDDVSDTWDSPLGPWDVGTPTPTAAGMTLSWTTDPATPALQAVWIKATGGVTYTWSVTVVADAGAADWRGCIGFQYSGTSTTPGAYMTPDGTAQTVRFEWTAPYTGDYLWGVETYGPTSSTHTVTDIRVWDSSDIGVRPLRRARLSLSPDDGASWVPRFDGYVDGWPAVWAGGVTEQARVRVTATDRLSRMGRNRVLGDALAEELGTGAQNEGPGWVLDDAVLSVLGSTTILSDGVVWLYGLQESAESTTFGDTSGTLGRPRLAATQVGSEGELAAGTAGIMPEGTAVQFSPASAGNGLVLAASSATAALGSEWAVFCQFAWSGSTGATLVTLGSAPGLVLTVTPTTVVATLTGELGASAAATKTLATGDNTPHFAVATVVGTTLYLYVDGESAATATVPAGLSTARGLTVGGTSSADVHQVAWVGYANAGMSADRAAVLGGIGSGGSESSGERVARILRWLDLDTDAAVDDGLSDVAYQATGGAQALDLLRDVNQIEGGVFYADPEGRLVQQSRGFRYSRPVDATVAAELLSADLEVAVDAARLVNDLTVSRPRGATVRVRDLLSIRDYGVWSPDPATWYAASDDDLSSAAQWHVSRLGQVAPYMPAVGVDLMSADVTTASAVLGLDVGRRLAVTGLPSTSPGGSTADLFVEGVEETISHVEWTVRLSTSQTFGQVWLLDDATYSVLGSTTTLAY